MNNNELENFVERKTIEKYGSIETIHKLSARERLEVEAFMWDLFAEGMANGILSSLNKKIKKI